MKAYMARNGEAGEAHAPHCFGGEGPGGGGGVGNVTLTFLNKTAE